MDKRLIEITQRVIARSEKTRARYLDRIQNAAKDGPKRGHLSCSGQAHAYAAMGQDKKALAQGQAPNVGIVTAYNDMLSAHKPFEHYPEIIRDTARSLGATAQVAGGVPAMCDGVTQGAEGMELSLFSRDVIAMSASVALSHNTFDAAIYLGVCDKIVPGLVMAAGAFGHIPTAFVPAGPMTSGMPNDEKAKVRQRFAEGKADRAELMQAEMAAYHGQGTCTFYGTANTNQMLMEFMGLHMPGASFEGPGTDMRQALTRAATQQVLAQTSLGNAFNPVGHVLSEKAFVNGLVGLMATGGSTNLVLHLPAMARAAGVILDLEDFDAISEIVPLLAKVYPNGLADVNHFHAAGGLAFLINQLLDAGLLHDDVMTLNGHGLSSYAMVPKLKGDGKIAYEDGPTKSQNDKIIRPIGDPFQPTGGLRHISGNLGRGVMKVSAVAPERRALTAPVRVFHDQGSVKEAFQANEIVQDTIIVVRFQGPKAVGMPELHSLTPVLAVLQDRGLKVALVTDGRMSGASGKVPAAIHVCPEAMDGGPLAKLRDGDIMCLDANAGTIQVLEDGFDAREAETLDLSASHVGMGRELFGVFRDNVGHSADGACAIF